MRQWKSLLLCLVLVGLTRTVAEVNPPVIVISPEQDFFPNWKTTFTLTCLLDDSWPGEPTVFWKRDGLTLYPNMDTRIEFSADRRSLLFMEVSQQQSGSYFCVAAEQREYLFESSETVELAVQEPPFVPLNLTVVKKTSTSLQLRWEPQGDIAADFYKVVQKPGDYEITAMEDELMISDLTPYTIYSFAVSAHNRVGDRGKSSALQTRTEPGPPSGVVEFSVGIRTSETLQIVWERPEQTVVNDVLTGYQLLVHATEANRLVAQQNLTSETTETVVSGLSSQTLYTVSMAFKTRCCVSQYSSKDMGTMREGETMAPTIHPRTEGNTARDTLSGGAIAGIALACGVLIVVILAVLLYFRCRSTPHLLSPGGSKHISAAWNDGTENGANDLIPISPPPEYTRGKQSSEAASSEAALDAARSHSFRYDAVPTTTPPPAYTSRYSRSSSNNDNSSISDLSNVDAMESAEIKEMNVPPRPASLNTSPARASLTPSITSPIYSVPHADSSNGGAAGVPLSNMPADDVSDHRGTYI